ncbi:MAG: hypothetical protein B6I31_05025 [Desulfobacteraceae bacterium 4572_19]|nr:MAG: hypothetical protein B6I31_05025 [Desulfobacteraceae bacterium 4572_19]
MNYEKYIFLNGHFIVAMPDLVGKDFERSVICICEHTEEGAFGIIINKIHQTHTVQNLFEELNIKCKCNLSNIPIYTGGHVQVNEVFILHGPPFDWVGCLPINSSLALCNTQDILEAIANGKGPKSYIIALGSAGWGAGQLENEIKENLWLNFPANSTAFHKNIEKKWDEVLKDNGIDPIIFSANACANFGGLYGLS